MPITEGLDPLTMLTDDTTIAMWQNEGLPSDRMSTENATILSNSVRWPLMIDPQVIMTYKSYIETVTKKIIVRTASRY